MSQNSEEEEEKNHLRLRRIQEFIDSHQQPKEELIEDNQEEQGEMAAANNRTLKELPHRTWINNHYASNILILR